MGLMTISPEKYGPLLAKVQPKVIESYAELEHFTGMLEALDRLGRNLTPEETALEGLLARLIADYDDKVELPDLPAHEVIAFLLRQRDLKQADLLPMFGLRSVASSVLNGKRELSKAHIRKLAEFFHSSPAAFF